MEALDPGLIEQKVERRKRLSDRNDVDLAAARAVMEMVHRATRIEKALIDVLPLLESVKPFTPPAFRDSIDDAIEYATIMLGR